MRSLIKAWIALWKVALVVGFASLGIFGLGLMIGVVVYPTGIFWGIIVFLLGLFGVLLALGTAMTAIHRPPEQASTTDAR